LAAVKKKQPLIRLGALLILLVLVSLWMGQQAYGWLPPQATAESQLVDGLFSTLVALGTFIFLGVTGFILYSAVFFQVGRYDIRDGPHIEGNVTLEVVWTAIPIILVIWIASHSYQIYGQMAVRGPMEVVHVHSPLEMPSAYAAETHTNLESTMPSETIEVTARQWSWSFHYPDANVTTAELHLPINHRIHLILRSEDVLHGFYVPAFRLKQDIIPNREIDFEFTPILAGRYRLDDSQFSGTYFALMAAAVVVEPMNYYQQWLQAVVAAAPTPAPNLAFAEYTRRNERRALKTGWATVVPAPPPLANQVNQSAQ
jgi:cytochrome c oxidase subunit II